MNGKIVFAMVILFAMGITIGAYPSRYVTMPLPDRTAAYIYDRWTGATSICTPLGCNPVVRSKEN